MWQETYWLVCGLPCVFCVTDLLFKNVWLVTLSLKLHYKAEAIFLKGMLLLWIQLDLFQCTLILSIWTELPDLNGEVAVNKHHTKSHRSDRKTKNQKVGFVFLHLRISAERGNNRNCSFSVMTQCAEQKSLSQLFYVLSNQVCLKDWLIAVFLFVLQLNTV